MENSDTHACFTAVPLQKKGENLKKKQKKRKPARLTVDHIKALGCILIYPMHAAVCNRISE